MAGRAEVLTRNELREQKTPRLLFVVNVAWFFISHRIPIAKAAKSAGYDVHLAAGSITDDERALLSESGIEFHNLQLNRSSRNPIQSLVLIWQLISIYSKLRPDIVHHVTIKPVLFGTFVARFLKIRNVVNAISGLGYTFSQGSRWLRAVVRAAYRVMLVHPRMVIIFQNETDRSDFAVWTGVSVIGSVLIEGSGVDLHAFVPQPEVGGVLTVVLPARMLRDKGVVEFAKAIGQLRSEGHNLEGILAGPLDPLNPEALSTSQLRELELVYGVRWVGHVGDVAELMAKSHIVCLPSYREGLPKVLIEAAASGRAVVATNVAGCRDVVLDGVTGLLVPPRDAGSLADAIRMLVVDDGKRRQFGDEGRLLAVRKFGVEMVVARTLKIYDSLLGI